ncbi:MAG: tRNA (adenine-N1)-methyltransferase [Actinomycetota bacterium]
MSEPFRAGEKALLLDARGRTYLITLKEGGSFHFHSGGVAHDHIIGQPEGVTAQSPSGATLICVRPRLTDFVVKMPRGAQVVYPKEIGPILMQADLYPGLRVLEAGTGSAALSIALCRAVGDGGAVVTYELRDDHREQGERNVRAFFGDVPPMLEFRAGDIRDTPRSERYDRMVLDMAQPWDALEIAGEVLDGGGIICAYVPTTIQVQDLVMALRSAGYLQIETLEVLHRTWHVEQRSVRPDHRMVGHTGFLVTARRGPVSTTPADMSKQEGEGSTSPEADLY